VDVEQLHWLAGISSSGLRSLFRIKSRLEVRVARAPAGEVPRAEACSQALLPVKSLRARHSLLSRKTVLSVAGNRCWQNRSLACAFAACAFATVLPSVARVKRLESGSFLPHSLTQLGERGGSLPLRAKFPFVKFLGYFVRRLSVKKATGL